MRLLNSEATDKERNTENDKIDEIYESGSIVAEKSGSRIHCLTVIGQIEGHYELGDGQKATKYEHIIPLLVSIEESDEVDGLLLVLNTMGGDVEAGLAMAELIAGMKKPTVSLVLGGGHSIGVPLAVSAKVSFISRSAAMTVHPVRMNGTVMGVPQTWHYFEKVQDRVVDFVERNSRIKKGEYLKLMMRSDCIPNELGSLVYGEEAVKLGLIDRLGSLKDALSKLHEMIDNNKGDLVNN